VGRPDSSFASVPAARVDQRPALQFRVLTDADRARELPVELRGRAAPEMALDGQAASLLLSPTPYPRTDLGALRIFLDHVLLAASAPPGEPPRPRRGLLLSLPKPKAKTAKAGVTRIDFAPLARDRAGAYLEALVADLFGRTHDYLLPCEAVFMQRRSEKELVECIAEVRDDPYYRRNSTTAYGAVPEPFDSPIPPVAEAQAFVERRFGLFFELRPSSRASQEDEDE
jgi:exodeoxyribonuclease V gamma subunit